jgi:hypothetical protein
MLETGYRFARALLVAALSLGAPLVACVSGAYLRSGVVFTVGAPPPPLRVEVAAVRPGPAFVWVPGHWDWRASRREYVWLSGRWLRPPNARAVWVEPRYERRGGGSVYVSGFWRY